MSDDNSSSKELPRQELLTKLLKMSASPNDGEALTAIRKANALLLSAGWDWDKLIAGKIVVVGDPFATLSTPKKRTSSKGKYAPPPPPSPRPATAPKNAPFPFSSTPPPPPPWRAPLALYSNKPNIYSGWCYCCGTKVDTKAGFIFNPHDHNSAAPDKWRFICAPCNAARPRIMTSQAKPIRPSKVPPLTPNLGQL